MNKETLDFVAVGVNDDQVCIALKTETEVIFFKIGEAGARKLADDILRNANYLWPEEGVDDE